MRNHPHQSVSLASLQRLILSGILIVCWFFEITLMAQSRLIPHFEYYTADDGLSENTVNTVLQDRHGFIWIGTDDGLNRYDGYAFKVFK